MPTSTRLGAAIDQSAEPAVSARKPREDRTDGLLIDKSVMPCAVERRDRLTQRLAAERLRERVDQIGAQSLTVALGRTPVPDRAFRQCWQVAGASLDVDVQLVVRVDEHSDGTQERDAVEAGAEPAGPHKVGMGAGRHISAVAQAQQGSRPHELRHPMAADSARGEAVGAEEGCGQDLGGELCWLLACHDRQTRRLPEPRRRPSWCPWRTHSLMGAVQEQKPQNSSTLAPAGALRCRARVARAD